LLLLPFVLLDVAVVAQDEEAAPPPPPIDYDELAANFGSTPMEILALGGLMDDGCTFTFNATQDNCDALMGNLTSMSDKEECGCLNFCNDELVGCFAVGGTPPLFECPIRNVVAGCRSNGTAPVSPLSNNPEANLPCPKGFMCTKTAERSCDEIREIPISLGLGDVHAGLYCPYVHETYCGFCVLLYLVSIDSNRICFSISVYTGEQIIELQMVILIAMSVIIALILYVLNNQLVFVDDEDWNWWYPTNIC